jgi:hypothetical protein
MLFFFLEALKKDLSLFLDSGRVRLCEAPCGADAALFRDSSYLKAKDLNAFPLKRVRGGGCSCGARHAAPSIYAGRREGLEKRFMEGSSGRRMKKVHGKGPQG